VHGIVALLAVLVLAGCGTSGSKHVGNAYTTAKPAVVVTPRPHVAHRTISIVKSGSTVSYQPRTATIKAGTIVVWVNKTGVPQTLTFEGRGLPSVTIKPGVNVSATFTRGGTFGYHTKTHPTAHGAIIVNAR
jgi:plastocyanin